MYRNCASRRLHAAVLGIGVVTFACSSGGGDGDSAGDTSGDSEGDAGTGGGTGVGAVPTFHEDIAPILAAQCQDCHQSAGAGPFDLITYDDATRAGGAMVHATAARTMPPYLADASGACNAYINPRWLTDEQIQTIGDWYEGGMPEGDPANALPPPPPPEHLGDAATHTVGLAMPYEPPANVSDDYRCFVLDPGIEADKFVTKFEVVPDNVKMVHHVIIYQPTDAQQAQRATDMDAAEAGYGYTCYGGPGVDTNMVAAWAPGTVVAEYPETTGVRVTAGTPVIMQVHYNLSDGGGIDQSRVDLVMEDSAQRELIPFFFAHTGIALEPGKENDEEVMAVKLGDYLGGTGINSVRLWGVGPHLHQRGTSITMALNRASSGEQQCLLDLPQWDFNWQLGYYFEDPMLINADDEIVMRCTYDMSDASEPIYWGDGTADEMCLMQMFVTLN